MRRLVVLLGFVLAAAVGVVVIARGPDGDTAIPTLEEIESGVGLVEALNCDGTPVTFGDHADTGSGFLIGSRVVMSVEHGMWIAQGKPACKLRVRFGDETYPVTTVRVWGEPGQKNMYERRGVDLATLTLARPVEGRHVFEFAAEGAPRGASVSTAGYPLGGPLKVSRGTVYRNLTDYGVPAVATNLAIDGGSSGGPIFTDKSEVVSVVSRVVVSGSLTRDRSSLHGGIDLPRWWGPDMHGDLCRVYGDAGIPDCGDAGETKSVKTSVVLLSKQP
jgi:hypothetical protein